MVNHGGGEIYSIGFFLKILNFKATAKKSLYTGECNKPKTFSVKKLK